MNIREQLEKQAELDYKKFSKRLIPGCDNILGIRIPYLRQVAKDIAKSDDYKKFLKSDEKYFEEVMIKGFVIGYVKVDIDTRLDLIKNFVPKINNWSICDSFSATLKFINKNKDIVFNFIKQYYYGTEFEQRFVAVVLMDYYLCDEYIDETLNVFKILKHDGYYAKMSLAWGLATAAAKYYDKTMEFMNKENIDDETYNMAIKKMLESFRISDEHKKILKTLKR